MNGSQGEIAHIDLTDGNEIRRVLLERDTHWEREEGGYWGDVIRLTVGRAGGHRVGQTWDGTVWNNRLEPLFQIEWAWLGSRRCGDGTSAWKGTRRASETAGTLPEPRPERPHDLHRTPRGLQIRGPPLGTETAPDETIS